MSFKLKKEKGKQTQFTTCDEGYSNSGINVSINKARSILEIDGWYDSMVGIRGGNILLSEVLQAFGKKASTQAMLVAEGLGWNPNIDSFCTPKHGVNCTKMVHCGNGYLHSETDDGEYDVDGMTYCGRCHKVL